MIDPERDAPTRPNPVRAPGGNRAAATTRLVAILVLVPTVPALLLSTAALAAFYFAPTRFGALLARLPGDEFIRTLLAFAPATLFAVVVLATLYALERPEAITTARREARAPGPAPQPGRRATSVRWGARLALVLLLPPFLGSLAARLIAFLAPDRTGRLLERLPGTSYLRQALEISPYLLLGALAVAALLALHWDAGTIRRLSRWAAGLSLLAAIPMLGLSVIALALRQFSPGRFSALIGHLPTDTMVRLGLVFAPLVLLALVLLAGLYLWQGSQPAAEGRGAPREGQRGVPAEGPVLSEAEGPVLSPAEGPVLPSVEGAAQAGAGHPRLAVAVLAGGLAVTSLAALALLGALLVLLLR